MQAALGTLTHRLCAIACLLAAPAWAFDLVTPDEVAADRQAAAMPLTRALPNPAAPRIVLDAPRLDIALPSPIDIRLRWSAVDGASIDPTSLRIYYGRLGIDITRRVAAASTISATGLDVAGAALPAGTHRIKIEIADNQQRTGSRQIEVTVAER